MHFLDVGFHVFDAWIVEKNGFGKLEFQNTVRDPIAPRYIRKRPQAVLLLKMLPGQIHRYREQLVAGILPTPNGFANLFEHIQVQFADVAVFFK